MEENIVHIFQLIKFNVLQQKTIFFLAKTYFSLFILASGMNDKANRYELYLIRKIIKCLRASIIPIDAKFKLY